MECPSRRNDSSLLNISAFACALCILGAACGGENANEAPSTPATAEAPPEAPTETPAETAAEETAPGALALGGAAPMASTEISVDDTMHSITSVAKENGTLVIFTCNHCPYAVAWQERLVALAHEYLEQGIGVIAINPNDPNEYASDSFEGTQARAQELSMRFPYVIDETSDVARAFGAEKTPELYLFDREGRLVYHGAVDDSQDPANVQEHHLRDALAAVVAGAPIAQAETLAVGCSIKFR